MNITLDRKYHLKYVVFVTPNFNLYLVTPNFNLCLVTPNFNLCLVTPKYLYQNVLITYNTPYSLNLM